MVKLGKTQLPQHSIVACSPLLCVLLGGILATSCNKTEFVDSTPTVKGGFASGGPNGQGNGNQPDQTTPGSGSGDPSGDHGLDLVPTFSVPVAASTAQTENAAWAVTYNGGGYRVVLDPNKKYPTTRFSGLGTQGHRTFVSKYGLFVGTTAGQEGGGKIYFVPNEVQEGAVAAAVVDLNVPKSGVSIGGGSRVCVIVYTVNKVDYLGAAFTASDGTRKFYRVPIDRTKAKNVDATKEQILNVSNAAGEWGYSCSYDPKRNYFYSKNTGSGGNIVGVDLTSPGPSMVTVTAPNAAHSMVGPGTTSFNYQPLNLTAGSYAMAISANGAILSDTSGHTYTMAHEPVSKNVFISNNTGTGVIFVTDERCFTEIADCSGPNHTSVFPVPSVPGLQVIGPMSSLNDGRILGLHRGNPSTLYMISLVDPKDRSKGLSVYKITDFEGDTYMYTDFSGSMTAAREISQIIDLTKSSAFKAGKPIKGARLKWREEVGTQTTWMGLALEVACMKKGATDVKGEPIAAVADANFDIDLSKIKGCSDVYDQVRIDIKPAATGVLVFSKTREFVFSGFQ